jgi:hypothetical protein
MAVTVGLRIQDKLNILAGTTGLSNAAALRVLNARTAFPDDEMEGWNRYAGTTGLSIQGAANVKAGGNVAPTTQVSTLTVGGTPEAGDVYTVILDGLATVTYTTIAGDTTNTLIAEKINTAIQAHPSYARLNITTSAALAVITLTAKTSGIPFSITSSATNGGAANDQTFLYAVTTPNVYMFTRQLRVQDAVNLI